MGRATPPGVSSTTGRSWLASGALLALVTWGCGEDEVYPGRADVRQGDRAEIRIEATADDETRPRLLVVPAGTEVTFANRTTSPVQIRFLDAMDDACGAPEGFDRTRDGWSYVSESLLPFRDARLCLSAPGRYRFVATLTMGPGVSEAPARYGEIEVVT
jgi:hypothetical protein